MSQNIEKIAEVCRGSKGFTLIETAVVIMVIGLFIAAAAPAYKQYRDAKSVQATQDAVSDVSNAIGSFRSIFGRYPCPAPLTARADNPAYGHEEQSCRDNTAFINIPAGTCVNGICVQQTVRDLNGDGIVNPATETLLVRIGAVPFRELNLQEDQSMDGYRHRLLFVVTEGLADADTYSDGAGGIEIVNDQNQSMFNPAGSGHFLVLSAGSDGNGAFTYEGTQIPCPAGGIESENCDMLTSNTASFRAAQRSDSVGATRFNDTMTWFTMSGTPKWKVSDPNKAVFDINQLQVGNVGIGGDPSDVGGAIGGEVRAQGVGGLNDGAHAAEICDQNDNCFPSTLVAEPDPDNYLEAEKGIKCDPGQFLYKIESNKALCTDAIAYQCPDNQMLQGFDVDGSPTCVDLPKKACPDKTGVPVCGANQTILAGAHNTVRTLSGGSCYTENWRCNNGAWKRQSTAGSCTFTSVVTNPPCGDCQSGNLVVTSVCGGPSTVNSSACVCDATVPTCSPTSRNLACSSVSGYSGAWQGTIPQTRNYTCPAAIGWSAWLPSDTPAIFANYCTCPPNPTSVHQSCAPNLTGTGIDIQYQNQIIGGTQCKKTEISRTEDCTCTPKTRTVDPNCDDGEVVATQSVETLTCPDGTWEVTTEGTCKPMVCTWKLGTFSGTDSFGRAPEGSPCTCGATGQCSTGGGSNYSIYDNCQCTGG